MDRDTELTEGITAFGANGDDRLWAATAGAAGISVAKAYRAGLVRALDRDVTQLRLKEIAELTPADRLVPMSLRATTKDRERRALVARRVGGTASTPKGTVASRRGSRRPPPRRGDVPR